MNIKPRKWRGRYRESLTHFLAECCECEWEAQDFINGPKLAASHARRTGHTVRGEKGYMVRYNDRELR